ncbi:MAG: hypothetical protein ACT4P5_01725 [Armatimonadota bacterium]
MKGRTVQRVLLALIPVALLTTGSLAFSVLNHQPVPTDSAPVAEEPAQPTDEAAPPRYMTSPNTAFKTLVAQNQPAPTSDQTAQADEQAEQKKITEIAQVAEEPLPELVVDKTPLTQALVELNRATEQAKLAITSLDAAGQARYIQEAINLLAGFEDPNFVAVTGTASAHNYKGVRPMLVQARVIREAAEVQWVAAVQQQMEARAKRLAEIAQAGSTNGTALLPSQGTTDLAAVVGPTGVLGTRGVRPEEQATELVSRAIRQATDALRMMPGHSPSGSAENVGSSLGNASDQATQTMEFVVRILESAKKIVQIAIDR